MNVSRGIHLRHPPGIFQDIFPEGQGFKERRITAFFKIPERL